MPYSAPPLSKQAAFARHGFQEGYPLWNPDPVPVLLPQGRQDGLEIGDVGIVGEDGCFNVVFNIYHSPDLSLAPRIGEPNIYVHETFYAGHVFSSPETSWRIKKGDAPYFTGPDAACHGRTITQYTSSLSEDGSHIIVPQGAKCSKLASRDENIFKTMAADPVCRAMWFSSASEHLGFRPSTLHLITGICQTRSWSLASFNRKDDQEIPVCCELVEEDGIVQVGHEGSHWTPQGRFACKVGPPVERQGNDNQTIFIQSFAITHNDIARSLLPQQLTTTVTREGRGPRGTTTSQASHRRTNNSRLSSSNQHIGRFRSVNSATLASESTATIQHIPPVSPPSHPSEIINQYLLTKQPSANAVITHDSLWISMLKKGLLLKLQDLETSLDALLSEHYLVVSSNGIVTLRDNSLSLQCFGIESPLDLTDWVKQDNKVLFSKHSFWDIYQGTLHTSHQTLKVAMKVVRIEPTNDSNFSEKLNQMQCMIGLWSELDHINILPLIWATGNHDQFTMVIPWTENGTLTSYLECIHEELTDVQVLALINDVASGLHYLHSKDILYGCLSGSNVAVDMHGTALLSEFSCMTLPDKHAHPGPLFPQLIQEIDILRWAAPELMTIGNSDKSAPKNLPTKQSDVYSFGAIMLQILSGKVPYHDHSTKEEIMATISRNNTLHPPVGPSWPGNPRLTDRCWAFLQQCWSPLESARPSMTEVVVFCTQELADAQAMKTAVTSTPDTGTDTLADTRLPTITGAPTQPSNGPLAPVARTPSNSRGLPATRMSGPPLAKMRIGWSPVSPPPPSGLPATRLSGTPGTRIPGISSSANLAANSLSASWLSGMPARPLSSERRSPDAAGPVKEKKH